MNSLYKFLISAACAFVVLFIFSAITAFTEVRLIQFIGIGVALSVGKGIYSYLTSKFPQKENPKTIDTYMLNAPVELHTEKGVINAFVSKEEDKDGLIEIHCLDEYKGELTHTFTHNELDRLSGKIKKPSNTMPMLKSGEPDFMSTTPEQGFNYLFKELGLQPADAQQLASNKLSAAKDELEEINRQMPQPGTDITNFVNEKKAWQRKADEAQSIVDYWTAVINLSKNN